MIPRNIYIIGSRENRAGWHDLISRLAWYFTPFLDQIDCIELEAGQADIDTCTGVDMLDPVIAEYLPAFRKKLSPKSATQLRERVNSVNSKIHLFLLAEKDQEENYRKEIGRFRPHGRFFHIDPDKDRMEGSFLLWAGLNGFVDKVEQTKISKARFDIMRKQIGHHEQAYVFGTGPSLSEYVAENSFDQGLKIIANSMVLNDDLLEQIKPQIIVAGDPIFHAGCSKYAAAFRAFLVEAMKKTGAWFICPQRDVHIYKTYLPDRLQERIVGIGFDHARPPPVDLAKQFCLKPYPNILTMLLLPLASTFAEHINIAGCDGRQITDDSVFWRHDKKAQFVDEMENIKAVHPGFFAISYNDYYLDHARDLETVLSSLEAVGKSCTNNTPSYIPALHVRENLALRPAQKKVDRSFKLQTVAILDPDAKGDWGHFLAYDKRLAIAANTAGKTFAIIGRKDLPQSARPDEAAILLNAFSNHSWTVGNKWPNTKIEDLNLFAKETDRAFRELEIEQPDEDILVFMYCGSVEVVELLEHVLVSHPRIRAVINLFWAYAFDIADPKYKARFGSVLTRVATRNGQVRVMHSTPQISAQYLKELGLNIPVLPHPSTTFSDQQAKALVSNKRKKHNVEQKPTVLFPVGPRLEKGYLLATEACRILSGKDNYNLSLRARIDATTDRRIKHAIAELDPDKVELVAGDLEQDAFIDWLANADVIVIPYLPEAFAARTSGMLVDAMLLGIPVVVIEDTWLADVVNTSKVGIVTKADAQALSQGIEQALRQSSTLHHATKRAAQAYLKDSSWAALFDQVLQVAEIGPDRNTAEMYYATLGKTGKVAKSMGSVEHIAKQVANGEIGLIAYDDPSAVLADTLEAGQDIDQAASLWITNAQAALDLYRLARDSVILIPRGHAYPKRVLAKQLPLSRLKNCSLPRELLTCPQSPDPLLYALGKQILQGRPKMAHLAAELYASGAFETADARIENTGINAITAYRCLMKSAEITERNLHEQKLTLQDQLSKGVESKGQLSAYQNETHSLGMQIQKMHQTAEVNNAEVTKYRLQSNDLWQEVLNLQNQCNDLTWVIEDIYQSNSWKITAPIRWLLQRGKK